MYLEPLLNDYRKVRFREPSGSKCCCAAIRPCAHGTASAEVVIKHIDEIVDDMLTKE